MKFQLKSPPPPPTSNYRVFLCNRSQSKLLRKHHSLRGKKERKVLTLYGSNGSTFLAAGWYGAAMYSPDKASLKHCNEEDSQETKNMEDMLVHHLIALATSWLTF